MFSTDFLPIFKFHLKIAHIFGCIPFTLDHSTGWLRKTQSHSRLKFFKVQCLLSILYSFTLLVNLLNGSLSLTQKAEGFVFFLIYSGMSLIRWNYKLDNSPMQVINSFLHFEADIRHKGNFALGNKIYVQNTIK